MRILNLGILAHVDAGKTSLTERLLYETGVIHELGAVDDGSTQTDTLALERQRGITIKSAVVSFVVNGVTVNLIDTPGHPDFIAEVERALGVLDGAVLVISAVEGVQAQTRVLMRTLQRLRIPALLFINKIDRAGADCERVLAQVRDSLTPAVVAMGTVAEQGTREACFMPHVLREPAFRAVLAERLAERDEALMAAYLDGRTAIRPAALEKSLRTQTAAAAFHPVLFGSALTGAGVRALMDALSSLLPRAGSDAAGPAAATVFKVERGPAGEQVAYLRMFTGTLHVRNHVQLAAGEAVVTAISVFENGSATQRQSISAGQIGRVWGLKGIRIGDSVGPGAPATPAGAFPPPSLETVVTPRDRRDQGRLYTALTQLAEQDPLINLRQDEVRGELSVSLYGEVQKEVIEATLAEEYRLEAAFRETTTVFVERPAGVGEAVEFMRAPGNPFLATVGLRIEPGEPGTGVEYRRASEALGKMPFAFFKAVEDTLREVLHDGLSGWSVIDCIVTMTHAGYAGRHSHAHQRFNKSMSSTGWDFRGLTPLVMMAAVKESGTVVCEPVHGFVVEAPEDTAGAVLQLLAQLGAVPGGQEQRGTRAILSGDIPAARVHELRQALPGLTRGEGVVESTFDHYEPVRGAPPARPRQEHHPLNRKEYLLHFMRRVR